MPSNFRLLTGRYNFHRMTSSYAIGWKEAKAYFVITNGSTLEWSFLCSAFISSHVWHKLFSLNLPGITCWAHTACAARGKQYPPRWKFRFRPNYVNLLFHNPLAIMLVLIKEYLHSRGIASILASGKRQIVVTYWYLLKYILILLMLKRFVIIREWSLNTRVQKVPFGCWRLLASFSLE